MKTVQAIAATSILIGLVVLGLKLLAWRLTGSIALYSDALESIVNVVTAVVALLAVRTSAKPADADHPFGHGKVEYFSAVITGVFIIGAAAMILREAWQGVLHPAPLDAPPLGLAVNAAAGIINAVWCRVLIRRGQALRSPALIADGRHLLTDVISSAGVLLGVMLATLTGWALLDPALAALVAVNILWSGWQLMRQSVAGLMDVAIPDEMLGRIRDTISAHAEGAIEAHDLRTRHSGPMTFVEFHLVVPGDMTVAASHAICDRLEREIRAAIGPAHIAIHVEPDQKAKHTGIPVL